MYYSPVQSDLNKEQAYLWSNAQNAYIRLLEPPAHVDDQVIVCEGLINRVDKDKAIAGCIEDLNKENIKNILEGGAAMGSLNDFYIFQLSLNVISFKPTSKRYEEIYFFQPIIKLFNSAPEQGNISFCRIYSKSLRPVFNPEYAHNPFKRDILENLEYDPSYMQKYLRLYDKRNHPLISNFDEKIASFFLEKEVPSQGGGPPQIPPAQEFLQEIYLHNDWFLAENPEEGKKLYQRLSLDNKSIEKEVPALYRESPISLSPSDIINKLNKAFLAPKIVIPPSRKKEVD